MNLAYMLPDACGSLSMLQQIRVPPYYMVGLSARYEILDKPRAFCLYPEQAKLGLEEEFAWMFAIENRTCLYFHL